MLPGFTANAALAGPRNVYHGKGLYQPTSDSVIAPQLNIGVFSGDDGGAEAPCVCPCCLYVPGLGWRCCNHA